MRKLTAHAVPHLDRYRADAGGLFHRPTAPCAVCGRDVTVSEDTELEPPPPEAMRAWFERRKLPPRYAHRHCRVALGR